LVEGIRIRELPIATEIVDTDVIVIDSVAQDDPTLTETRQILYPDLVKQLELDLEIEGGGGGVADPTDVIILPYDNPPRVFQVTLGDKTENNRYFKENSPGEISVQDKTYYIDGMEAPYMILTPGRTYRFELSEEVVNEFPMTIFAFRNRGDFNNPLTEEEGLVEGDGFVELTIRSKYRNFYYDCKLGQGFGGNQYDYMGNGILNPDGDEDFNNPINPDNPWPLIEALQASVGTIGNSIAEFSQSIASINDDLLTTNVKLNEMNKESDDNDELHAAEIIRNHQAVMDSIANLKEQLELSDLQLNQRIDDMGDVLELE